jgi:hypothetical protein
MPIVGRFGSLAGLGSLILPGGAMESIATVTVGSGVSTATLSAIPSTFQHLQVRLNMAPQGWMNIRPNGTAPVITHRLYGDGSSAGAASYSTTYNGIVTFPSTTYRTVAIVDILDYASTSKTKTLRVFAGMDENGAGSVELISHLYNSTTAITSLDFVLALGGSLGQSGAISLYGLRS